MTCDRHKAYRFLTGDDDVVFCQGVTSALRNGSLLDGPPLLQVNEQVNRHCGQAVVLPEFVSAKKRCYRFKKLSGKPGASHRAFTKRPVDDRVI